jgi:hypothetical protein
MTRANDDALNLDSGLRRNGNLEADYALQTAVSKL